MNKPFRNSLASARSKPSSILCDEGHVLPPGPLDPAAADDPVCVGSEHHLEQHLRRLGPGARLIDPVPRIKVRDVDLVLEQMMDRVPKGPGRELVGQVDGQEARVGVDVFLTGHLGSRREDAQAAASMCPFTHDRSASSFAILNIQGIFLHPRYIAISLHTFIRRPADSRPTTAPIHYPHGMCSAQDRPKGSYHP